MMKDSEQDPTAQATRELEQQVNRLASRVDLLERILEVRDHRLRPTEEEAAELLGHLKTAEEGRPWSPGSMLTWAGTFLRIDDETFHLLVDHTGDPDLWKRVYSLCLNMLKSANRPGARTKPELRRAIDALHAAKTSLQKAIVFYTTISDLGSVALQKGPDPEASVKLRLLSSVGEKLANFTG